MEIVQITSELAPIAKVGGLADVVYGLSKALQRKGHQVKIILPKYDCIDYHLVEELQVIEENRLIEENNVQISTTIWSAKLHDLDLYLIETSHPKFYFNRKTIYGESDDTDRFLFFCKVASSLVENTLVHIHDWLTAGCALFQKNKTIFTIHNAEYQGRCALFNLERLGVQIDEETLKDPQYDSMNLVRGAIEFSSAVTTVSPSYAKEILDTELGFGLQNLLKKNRKKFRGILNGIDFHYWDPKKDSFLVQPYGPENVLEGKRENKRHLLKSLHLQEEESRPLVCSITRLTAQKGPDLIHYGIQKILELGGQFILLGSGGNPELEAPFKEYEHHPNVAIHLTYDESFSHMLYASCDFLFMPSIFEPCGLAQMIALRYGTIPLVRSTGGLKDTIFDPKESKKPNGFSFEVPDNTGVSTLFQRAFAAYKKEGWEELIQSAMACDNSWDHSAESFIEIYTDCQK